METVETSSSSATLRCSFGDRFAGPYAEEVVARLARPDLADVRAVVSWRGVAASDEVCHVSLALAYLDLLQRESCGRCTPCRIGTDVMRRAFRRLQSGQGSQDDIESVRELAEQIDDTALCGVANTVREPILGLLEVGAEHLAAHAAGSTCPDEKTVGWITAPCRSTCPSTVDCPSYIFQIMEEHPRLATRLVKQDNPLPAVIGRTCHHPCEGNCSLNPVGQPIGINALKRWAADRAEGLVAGDEPAMRLAVDGLFGPPVGEERLLSAPHEVAEAASLGVPLHAASGGPGDARQRVAIVGAGPAGLSAAYYLARWGYRPVVFEALPVPGGMLYVGIPEYRLPKGDLQREVDLIADEGVEIRYGQAVGRDVTFATLLAEYPAVFLGIGAHSGKKLKIPGEELPGSMDAIDFLRQVALGQPVTLGERVLVIGGGNSAMDAARTALRLGARDVTIVYRRAREQMPANPWEIEEAEEEGVGFRLLSAPVRCEGDTCVSGLVCQPMELGAPDKSGRRSPVPVACDPFSLDADTIIAAVGQRPDFSPFVAGTGLELNQWGYLECDPYTGMTTRAGVFVGGDAVNGGASVIEAIAAGKSSAKYIDRYLRGEAVREDDEDRTRRIAVYLGAQDSRERLLPGRDYGRREPMPMLPPQVRRASFSHTELGYSTQQARVESHRCLRCHRPLVVAF